tara:strand:- start:69 stop:1103 length:1035 start_codon:yes stop_codon:yes gene_type:complete
MHHPDFYFYNAHYKSTSNINNHALHNPPEPTLGDFISYMFFLVFNFGMAWLLSAIFIVKFIWLPMIKDGERENDEIVAIPYEKKYSIVDYLIMCKKIEKEEEDESGSEYETSGDESESEDGDHGDDDLNHGTNNLLLENTPIGLVSMNYNREKEGFNYWSNKQIPFEYINTVARKYVITFNCTEYYLLGEEERNELSYRLEEEEEDSEDEDSGKEGEGDCDAVKDKAENDSEDKNDAEDAEYDKIIQSEINDIENKKDEEGELQENKSTGDTEGKNNGSDDDDSDDDESQSDGEEENEDEKKLHNKFIYQGNIRNLKILNKKGLEKPKKQLSFAEFMQRCAENA